MRVIRASGLKEAYEKGVGVILDHGYFINVKQESRDVQVLQYEEVTLDIRNLDKPRWSPKSPLGELASAAYDIQFFQGPENQEYLKQIGKEFEYTYWERIFKNPNQAEYVIKTLKEDPMSRQAEITIRRPEVDIHSQDPPCLQKIHFYSEPNGDLVMLVNFRSNDWYGALLQNLRACLGFFEYIAKELNRRPVRYIHIADCPHIYSTDLKKVRSLWG